MAIQKQKKKKKNGLCKLAISEEMNIYCAQQLKDEVADYWPDYNQFEIDLSDVAEIDSAGIQLLLLWHKEAKIQNKTIIYQHCSQAVHTALDVYQLHHRLAITPNGA